MPSEDPKVRRSQKETFRLNDAPEICLARSLRKANSFLVLSRRTRGRDERDAGGGGCKILVPWVRDVAQIRREDVTLMYFRM